MKDIIKYSARIFAIILIIYLGVNIYNFKAKAKVTKLEGYIQNVQKNNEKTPTIKEEKEYKELIENKNEETTKESTNANNNEKTIVDEKTATPENNTNVNTNQTTDKDDNKTTRTNNDKEEYTATFYIGKKLYAENCSEKNKTCVVKFPKINVDGYEALGWSTDPNAKNPEFNTDSQITLNESKIFYAIIRKKVDIKFINNVTNENEVKSCYIYNDETGCNIVSPEIKAKDNYLGLGWANTANQKQIQWGTNTDRKVSESKTYYSVVRSKNAFRVGFTVQDDNAVTTTSTEEICYLYNNDSTCKITVPTLKVKNNSTEIIGWSTDEDSKTSKYKGGETLEISNNRKYYSITKSKVTIKFDTNKSYDNNTVKERQTGYNYSKSNIAAEKLSFYETSCYSYNGYGCKITKVPIIYSKGNEIRGFSKTSEGSPVNVYNITFKNDTTLYARVYNNEKKGILSTYYYGTIGNMPIEMETKLSQESRNSYWNYIKQLYNDMPVLFNADGKMTLLAESTYASVVGGSSSGITGGNVPNILINIPTNVVLDKNREATIVHELGHAFGDKYGRRTGHYPENNQELLNLFNKYKTYSVKPLREYAYVHINEFFAEIFRFSYEEKYHRGTDIGNPTNEYTYRTTPEIINIVDRYICVAKNDYNESACR